VEIFFLRVFILSIWAFSFTAKAYDIEVACKEGFSCQQMSQKIEKSLASKKTQSGIRENLRFLLLDSSISELDFSFSENSLKINFSQRPLIKDIQLTGKLQIDENIIQKTLRLSEGGFYDPVQLQGGVDRLIQYYRERGFEEVKVVPNITKTDSGVLLNFNIDPGNFIVIKDVSVSSDSEFLKTFVKSRLIKFRNKPWNMVNIKIELDSLTRDLFSRGYFFSNIKLQDTPSSKGKKNLDVVVEVGLLYNFDFKGNKTISRGEILNEIKEFLLNNFETVNAKLITEAIKKIYIKRGIYQTEVSHRLVDGVSKSGDQYRNIFFYIKEGKKIPIEKLVFNGVGGITKSEVEDYYYDNSTGLAARDYLDRDYIEKFPSLLKRMYLKKGYLFIEVSEPVVTFSPDKAFCNVTFYVNERQQSILEKIEYPGVDKPLKDQLVDSLVNKIGKPLNVVDLEEDLANSLRMVRDDGYFFARLNSTDPEKLILHKSNYNRSSLFIDFDLGKKTRFESILVTGHQITKQKVIAREVRLEKDDIVTPDIIQRIKDRIVSLGLFSQVKITPFVTNRDTNDKDYYVNLLIQVNEKDFGSGEVAPGYRTDIGYKISSKVAYNNVLGLNHSASFKAQTNWRDNLKSLDARRKEEDRNLQEFLFRFNYTWPYAFPSRWKYFHNTEFSFSPSWEQRRLFSFDAVILKGAATLSKELKTWKRKGRDYELSGSLKYQFEKIRQFDASSIDNQGKFIIGALTPSINLDMRNRSVSPSEGAFFGLSVEFANPIFGSLSRDDLEINFWKVISRNKLYYPLSQNWTLALSISTGVQKNLEKTVLASSSGSPILNENGVSQTKGFIPSIKVFRLDGPDAVRGFATSEINRLPTGNDVSEVRIQDKAFFTNLKFEPRYSVNDAVVISPFFDAGRVFVNNFKPLDLKTSAGVSLKFVTPAGTLDFDYGFKLKRSRLSDGGREGFGRFHLQIGFF
tara:strand:+ start:477430 stop:480327 length:2898 start_codon:yes stop_codon:yes gene_type:complete